MMRFKLIYMIGFLPLIAFSVHSVESNRHSREYASNQVANYAKGNDEGTVSYCGASTESDEERSANRIIDGGKVYNLAIWPKADGSFEPVPYSSLPTDCRGENFTKQCLEDDALEGARCASVFVNKEGEFEGELTLNRVTRGKTSWTNIFGSEIGKTGDRAKLQFFAIPDINGWGSLMWVAYPPCKGKVAVAKFFERLVNFGKKVIDHEPEESEELNVADSSTEKAAEETKKTREPTEKKKTTVAKIQKKVKAKKETVVARQDSKAEDSVKITDNKEKSSQEDTPRGRDSELHWKSKKLEVDCNINGCEKP